MKNSKSIISTIVIGMFGSVLISNLLYAKDLAKGKAVYTANCASCHGDKGDGLGPAGAVLKPTPRNFISDPFKKGDCLDNVIESVTKGLPGTLMVAYAHLKKDEIKSVSEYVLSFRKKAECKKKP